MCKDRYFFNCGVGIGFLIIFCETIIHFSKNNKARFPFQENRLCTYFYQIEPLRSRSEGLSNGNFVDACLMASAFKIGSEEFRHDLVGHCFINETSRHHQYVGIVVLTGQMSNFRNPAKCGTDTLVFVQGDTDSFTTSADGNSRIAFSVFYCQSQRVSKVGIVTTVGCVSSEIFVFPSFGFQPFFTYCFNSNPAWSDASPIVFIRAFLLLGYIHFQQ